MGTSTIGIEARAGAGTRQNDLRLKEAEHRHGNTLLLLSSLVRRCLRDAEGEEAREALSSISELVDTLARLHKLSQELVSDPAVLLRGMGRQWQRLCNGHIRIVIDAEEGLQMPQSSQTVAILIAQELVQNAIRTAFPDQHSGTIHVRLYARGEKDAILEVENDGIGAPDSEVTCGRPDASAHGHSLVRDLSLTLGGTICRAQARQGYGQCVTVCWPL